MKPIKNTILCTVLLSISLFSCSTSVQEDLNIDQEDSIETEKRPNILFVIADDMGLDATPGYAIGTVKPYMPNLQNLIDSGVRFNNLWSSPTCSPTRASILTGKYAIRNGVVKVGDVLSTSQTSLHSYINTNTNAAYSTAVIGKWHLSTDSTHPNDMGIPYYAGSLGGGLATYTNWTLNINGQTQESSDYITTKTTDLAIDWIENQTKPWFLWLAYNAPHPPFHLPPSDLHHQGDLPIDQLSIDNNPLPYYMAMIEALDTEYGRLLASMTQEEKDNTLIIFIGDNGTPNQVLQEYRRGKGTIYQGGINVPMIIAGKGVTRINKTEDALINTTDLFATLSEISGVDINNINDSKSFKSLLTTSNNTNSRDYVFVEDGNDDGTIDYTIRNTTHKYVLFENGNEAFYNLTSDPFETENLLRNNASSLNTTDTEIKNTLITKMTTIRN